MKCCQALTFYIFIGSLLLAPVNVYAFDTRTHVLVGNEVFNDLKDDGMLSIEPFGAFTVDAIVRDSILNNKDIFLMGNVGPDGFPDLIAGQVTTHPGIREPGGWGTDGWLKHIIRSAFNEKTNDIPKSVAFSYGYLGHAAGDYFMHTYVNNYAGDMYELTDSDGMEVEVRHMALEKYVAEKQPALSDDLGNSIGAPDIQIARGDNLPTKFLSSTLIVNPSAKHQYELSGMAPHLVAMRDIEVGLGIAVGALDEIEVYFVLQWLGSLVENATKAGLSIAYSPADLTLTAAQKLDDICANVMSKITLNVPSEFDLLQDRQSIARYNELRSTYLSTSQLGWGLSSLNPIRAVASLWDAGSSAVEIVVDTVTYPLEVTGQLVLDGIIYTVDAAGDIISETVDSAGNALKVTVSTTGDVTKIVTSATGEVITTVANVSADGLLAVAEIAGEAVVLTYSLHKELIVGIARLQLNVLTEIVNLGGAAAGAVTTLVGNTLGKLCSNSANPIGDLNSGIKDTIGDVAEFSGDLVSLQAYIDAVRFVLNEWRTQVERANEQYIKTSGEVAYLAMSHNGSIVDEYKNFVSCHAPVYVGVPKILPATACGVDNIIKNFWGALEDTFGPLAQVITYPIDKIKEKILEPIKSKAANEIIDLLGGRDYVNLYHYAMTQGSEDNLKEAYSLTGQGVGLLTIPDIVERVNSDLNLDENGKFDKVKFAPFANAVTLAKMALLNEKQMNELVQRAGVVHTFYAGTQLFVQLDSSVRFNVMFNSVKSIDGNHGWMKIAPPFIRSVGNNDKSSDAERTFGYDHEATGNDGFRLWVDKDARDKVFKKIFVGPIANALEYPSSVGLPEIIPMDYAERVCSANPFPIDPVAQRCGSLAAWLVPILGLLN